MVVKGDIHSDFDTSGIVLDMCQSCNILVQRSGILSLWLCYGKDLVCNFLKMYRVLTTYSVTFLSGVMMINKISIHKLAFFPIFFIVL